MVACYVKFSFYTKISYMQSELYISPRTKKWWKIDQSLVRVWPLQIYKNGFPIQLWGLVRQTFYMQGYLNGFCFAFLKSYILISDKNFNAQ